MFRDEVSAAEIRRFDGLVCDARPHARADHEQVIDTQQSRWLVDEGQSPSGFDDAEKCPGSDPTDYGRRPRTLLDRQKSDLHGCVRFSNDSRAGGEERTLDASGDKFSHRLSEVFKRCAVNVLEIHSLGCEGSAGKGSQDAMTGKPDRKSSALEI